MSCEPPPGRHAETSFLAFDFGLRRVGVASGNTLLRRPAPADAGAQGDARFAAIAA
jgi:putative Holliday junction resolvase